MKFLKTKKGILVGILSALGVGLVLWFVFGGTAYAPEPESFDYPLPTTELTINNIELTVEIAEKPEDKATGLSGRERLGEDHGMLFVFTRPDIYSFWMKDMKFPIDIIWIGDGKQIVDIHESVSPETYPESFRPKAPAQYVLEVEAGFIEEHGIKEGAVVGFDLE